MHKLSLSGCRGSSDVAGNPCQSALTLQLRRGGSVTFAHAGFRGSWSEGLRSVQTVGRDTGLRSSTPTISSTAKRYLRGLWYRIGRMQMLGRMLLHVLPSFAVVDFHPIVISVLDIPNVLECLSEQVSEVVIVWRILEAEVADVAQVFVELFGNCDST